MRNAKNPADFVRKRVSELSAYHVEPIPAKTVLDANELGLSLPDELTEAIDAAIGNVNLNRYPDPDALELRKAIAKKEGCSENNVLLGNGSDEIIQALIASLCDPGDKIFTPTPTFTMYKRIATFLNVETAEAELDEQWDICSGSLIMQIDDASPRIIFVASPNNPTGNTFNRDRLASIMNTSDGLIVIDEAYIDYADRSIGLLFEDRSNVAIMRTLSKIGLAGIRLGYLLADERLIAEVNKVRLPYNISSVTQATATVAFDHWEAFEEIFKAVRAERQRMFIALFGVKGVIPYPSQANFLLMKINGDPKKVFDSLIKQSVRVRWFEGSARLKDCFRVTIGSPAENDKFIEAIKKAL